MYEIDRSLFSQIRNKKVNQQAMNRSWTKLYQDLFDHLIHKNNTSKIK
jgi:hypothetical protein